MIALDTGDKLRAYASVADKIDYTLHGMVNDEVAQLSDGQLAGAEADIYTAPSDAGLVSTVIFVNTHNAAVTCNLYLKPSGGTSRRIIPKDISIDAGLALHYDGIRLFTAESADAVSVTSHPADTFVAEDGALGKGVLLQGDDGADRKNVLVDAAGHLQVDVLSGGGGSSESVATEGEAAAKGTQISLDNGSVSVYAQGNAGGDLKVTLDSEAIVLGTGSAAIGKLAANSGVDIGDVDVVSHPADTFVAEDGALGKGVLLQGDDGTDRKNVSVDTAGHLQVDVLSGGGSGTEYTEDAVNEQPTGGVSLYKQRVAGAANDILIVPAVDAEGHVQVDVLSGGGSNDSVATEGVAATKGTQISLDDGTNSHYAQANAAGDLKITLDSEAVVLGTGSTAIGKLAANSGVDIGDVDVLSLPTLPAGDNNIGNVDIASALPAGSNAIGKLAANNGVDIGDVDVTSHPADTFVAEDGALGKGVLLQGDDGADRKNVAVDASGNVQVDVVGALPAGSAAIGKLAANSGVDIGDVDVTSLPNKLAAWTQVVVNINTATTTELIAANAGHTYTILTVSLTIAAENNLTFKSASTAKTGPMDFGKTGESHGWQANFWPVGIKCVAGEALNLTTTTTGQVSGIICVLDES